MHGEAIRQKLNSGFTYSDEVVQSALRYAMKKEIERWFDEGRKPKLHITLAKSRRVVLVPDRYRLLEEMEVPPPLRKYPYLTWTVIYNRFVNYD